MLVTVFVLTSSGEEVAVEVYDRDEAADFGRTLIRAGVSFTHRVKWCAEKEAE